MTGLRNSTDATFLGLLVPITLLGAALRFAFLGAQAPSIDEGWSVGAVLGGFDHMVEVVSRDTHPPLYFFLQWLQVHTLGPGLATDRLVAAAFGTAAVPITMLVARRVSAGAFPTFAGLLVAVSPLALFTSRDARPHVAAATLALAATWLLLRALERPAWLRLGAYAAAAAGTVLTSYAGIAVLAAHALAACALRPSGPGRWVTTGGGAMLLCLPWLLFAAPQLLRARGILFSDPSGGPGGHLIEFLRVGGYALTGGFSLVDEFNPWLAALVLLPVGTGLFFGKGLRPRSMIPSFPLMGEGESERDATGATNDVLQAGSQRPVTLVVLLVVLTTLVFFAVTSALGGQFVARYLTPLVAPLAVLYALAVWRLPRPSRAVAAAILLLGWSWTSIDVLTRDKAHRDATELAAFLEGNVQPNDAVVFDWFSTRGQVVALVPRLWQQSSEGGYDLTTDINRALDRGGQVWLVADNTMADRQELLASISPLLVDVTLELRRVIAFRPEGGRRADSTPGD